MKYINFLILFLGLATLATAQNPNPLPELEFETLRKEIESQSFDSKRLDKAKALSDSRYLYVNQIKAIMEGLSLESNRLSYAKYAYSTTLDAENYKDLLSIFRMQNNKDELTSFIAKRDLPTVPKVEKKVASLNQEGEESVTKVSTTQETPAMPKENIPNPMDDKAFSAAKLQASEESYESAKFRRVKQISDANFLLASQVKELLAVLSFESNRLDFARYAYPRTFDQGNYSVVKEGLKYTKSKDELAAFIKKQPVKDYAAMQKNAEEAAKKAAAKAKEEKTVAPVQTTLSEDDFKQLKNQVATQTSDIKKLDKAKAVIDRTDITTAQAVELTQLFLFGETRLAFAKAAYTKVVDKDQYNDVKMLLDKDNHKDLEDYIKQVESGQVVEEKAVPMGESELSNDDFELLKKNIKGAALESTKLAKAKTVVDRSKVSAGQVQQLNKLFSLEETRLEFAQYAYSKTLDKKNYSIVRETLDKNANRYKLDRYIKEQQ